ncbi:MAG: hypothetical protein HYZ42_00470 [Bacteroidetes bacterium]|nr:hypothetical protein [Bacteroidota bacterium]
MNKIQSSKLNTCNRVIDCLTKYATPLASITEFAQVQTKFLTAVDAINNALLVQSQTTHAATDAVAIAKEAMAEIVIKYAKRGRVMAKELNNVTLFNHLDHGISYITSTSKTSGVKRAMAIRDALNNNLATLTNVTASDINEISNAIAAYDAIKENPMSNIQDRAASGTNPLPEAFEIAFDCIESMNDLVDSYYSDTNKPMVDAFKSGSMIINTGTHHNGVSGYITKDGKPAVNATVTIEGTDKIVTTDMDGFYDIIKVKSGKLWHTLYGKYSEIDLMH